MGFGGVIFGNRIAVEVGEMSSDERCLFFIQKGGWDVLSGRLRARKLNCDKNMTKLKRSVTPGWGADAASERGDQNTKKRKHPKISKQTSNHKNKIKYARQAKISGTLMHRRALRSRHTLKQSIKTHPYVHSYTHMQYIHAYVHINIHIHTYTHTFSHKNVHTLIRT